MEFRPGGEIRVKYRRPPTWTVTLVFVPILVLFPFVFFAINQPEFLARYWHLLVLLFGLPWTLAMALWLWKKRKLQERPGR
jgi:hypothetical protein